MIKVQYTSDTLYAVLEETFGDNFQNHHLPYARHILLHKQKSYRNLLTSGATMS